MKTPSRPPFDFADKTSSAGSRPAFPARLEGGGGNFFATQKIAASARVPSAASQNHKKIAFPGGVSDGLGLDLAVRARMVHRLAEQGVLDGPVLAALRSVERHHFVDAALASLAYEDTSLPIGFGQTISKPNVVARMLELLQQGVRGAGGRLGRVLEIGTGCGYQAAVLSLLATEVYSMERLRALHDKARQNLRPLRLSNVHLLFGDGMNGFARGAPYAAIIAAAGGDAIPPAWTEQLAVGGRLVAPLQHADGTQSLVVIDKTPQGLRQALLEPVHFVPLKSGTG
ncbi:MAG: protein-L-isoaspartate(D-aspartate) O-methyltransferase [Polaromonas sp.]